MPLGACLAETKGRRSAKYAARRYGKQQFYDRRQACGQERPNAEALEHHGKSAHAGMPVPLGGGCLAATKGRGSAKYAALRYKGQQSFDCTLNV